MSNLFKESTNIYNNKSNELVSKEKSGSTSSDKANSFNKLYKNLLCNGKYYEGQIVCGKVGKYPWWPCMINSVKEEKGCLQILVSYFGEIRDYSYLDSKKILDVQTKKQYDIYVQNLFDRFGKKGIHSFKYSSRYNGAINRAWAAAGAAQKMDDASRFEKYRFKGLEADLKPKKRRARRKRVMKKRPFVSKVTHVKVKEPIFFGFSQLTLPYIQVKLTEKCCRYCLLTKDVFECENRCGSNFHLNCLQTLMNMLKINRFDFKSCVECKSKKIVCYVCYKAVDIKNKEESVQCYVSTCRKWYHHSCVFTGPLYEMIKETNSNNLICPRHLCHKCELINPFPKYKCNKLIVCIMCPATYHTGDWCIPAGSVELTPGEIICPKHLFGGNYINGLIVPPYVARIKSSLQSSLYDNKLTSISEAVTLLPKSPNRPFNVDFCFKCATGGDLLCCESCPAAYHQTCTSLTEIPAKFYCDDCSAFCYRSYGEIIWIKCGQFRWWPGQILHCANVPINIMNRPHIPGNFVVQFFGSHDYLWTDQGKVFPYEEEDKHHLVDKKRIINTNKFREGLIEASEVYSARKLAWKSNSGHYVLNPKSYFKIISNRYTANMRRSKSIHQCDCSPDNEHNACTIGSNCINIELKYECHPDFCKMKEKCCNQNFMKRNYPKQEVFWAGECGWALKTKEFIEKYQLVNEYVGEVIDLDEANNRTERANKNNITDFYYMELDNNRIIDARIYSNLSRFMNHSCNPNLRAEKWYVNGDPRIGLFALRDINEGEELTFNYNLYTNTFAKIVCKCKSENCSGFIGDAPKKIDPSKSASTGSRKILKAKKQLKNRENEESESISKSSITNTSSCVSFRTYKIYETSCFRCSEPALDSKDIICTVHRCTKIYHADCLDLDMKFYKREMWICPWHFCDWCGRPSSHYCSFCTTSVCDTHNSSGTFPVVNDGINTCSRHE